MYQYYQLHEPLAESQFKGTYVILESAMCEKCAVLPENKQYFSFSLLLFTPTCINGVEMHSVTLYNTHQFSYRYKLVDMT